MDKESNLVRRRNDYSAGNDQLIDEESTRGIFFRWELPAHGRGIYPMNIFPPGIASSWTRNLPEEYFSAGNHQLMDEVFTARQLFCNLCIKR
jgi:hypothetical protein